MVDTVILNVHIPHPRLQKKNENTLIWNEVARFCMLKDINLREWRQQVYIRIKFIECIVDYRMAIITAIVTASATANIENSCIHNTHFENVCVFAYVPVEICTTTRIVCVSKVISMNEISTISLIERHIIFASTFFIHVTALANRGTNTLTHMPTHIRVLRIYIHTQKMLISSHIPPIFPSSFAFHVFTLYIYASKPHAYEWINKMNVNELFMHAYEKQKRQVKVKLKSANNDNKKVSYWEWEKRPMTKEAEAEAGPNRRCNCNNETATKCEGNIKEIESRRKTWNAEVVMSHELRVCICGEFQAAMAAAESVHSCNCVQNGNCSNVRFSVGHQLLTAVTYVCMYVWVYSYLFFHFGFPSN